MKLKKLINKLNVNELKDLTLLIEKQILLTALKQNNNNINITAKKLNISRATIFRRMRALGIKKFSKYKMVSEFK